MSLIGTIRDALTGLVATVRNVNTQVTTSDNGMVTNAVIHGKTTAGGSTYVDVKVTPSGAVSIDGVAETTPSDNLSMSEFGARRVESSDNRFDVEFLYDKQPLLVDDISSGTGSATHQTNGRHVLLAVGGAAIGATGGERAHSWITYTPGSGQEIDITGVLDAAAIGGGTAQVFLRSKVTGTVTLETIDQASWVAATSGVTWSYSQIFRISFQSLRVGRIQFSLVSGGIITKVAEILNDNERASGFWQYANLPPYWKVYNVTEGGVDKTVTEFGYGDDDNGVGFRYVWGSVQSTATAIAICSTVKSQGGGRLIDLPGTPWVTPILAAKTVSTTLIPLLSVRVASTFNSISNRALVIPTGWSVATDQPIDYALIYRPTLTGAAFAAIDATYNGVEYDNTASAITGGYRVEGDYITAAANNPRQAQGILERVIMSLGSTGTADILTIAAIRAGSSNASVRSYIKGKELR